MPLTQTPEPAHFPERFNLQVALRLTIDFATSSIIAALSMEDLVSLLIRFPPRL